MPSSHESPPVFQQLPSSSQYHQATSHHHPQQQPAQKRPSLAQRTSSTTSITRNSLHSSSSALSNSHKTTAHKPHRPHIVGGAHRPHARNPSYGKNLNKLQRLHSTTNVTADHQHHGHGEKAGRPHHQRKKSTGGLATTPAESPRPAYLRQNSSHTSLTKAHSTVSIKKNHSVVGLKKNASAGQLKRTTSSQGKAHHHGHGHGHHSSRPAKKAVGFEIGDSDDEEDEEEDEEWEDSSHSPATTRQNSANHTATHSQELPSRKEHGIQPSSPLARNHHGPLQSLPTSAQRGTVQSHSSTALNLQDKLHHPDLDAITSRLLYEPRGQKAPPAMSSVSAVAAPSHSSVGPGSYSLIDKAEVVSIPNSQNMASSSAEGGVSRFIDGAGGKAASTYASSIDHSTPSSFVQSGPMSSSENAALRPKTPPSSKRISGVELPSRTQQKLWLQRTAALTMSPDTEGAGVGVSPVIETASMLRPSSRNGLPGAVRRLGVAAMNDPKQVKRLHERSVGELNTVRRFRNPVCESLARVELGRVKGTNGKAAVVGTNRANALLGASGDGSAAVGYGFGLSAGASSHGRTVSATFEKPGSQLSGRTFDSQDASQMSQNNGLGIVAGIRRTLSRKTLPELERRNTGDQTDMNRTPPTSAPHSTAKAANLKQSLQHGLSRSANNAATPTSVTPAPASKGVRFQMGASVGAEGGESDAEGDEDAGMNGNEHGNDENAAATGNGGRRVGANGPTGSAEEALLRRMWESREVMDFAE